MRISTSNSYNNSLDSLMQRQFDKKTRTLSDCAFQPDPPVMHLQDLPGDKQSKSQTTDTGVG